MSKKRWYLVAVQFGEAGEERAALIERLRHDVPIIQKTLADLSISKRLKPVARSTNGDVVLWVLQTISSAREIGQKIMNPASSAKDIDSVTPISTPDTARSGDKIFVFQLGEDRQITANVIRTWLDREWSSA